MKRKKEKQDAEIAAFLLSFESKTDIGLPTWQIRVTDWLTVEIPYIDNRYVMPRDMV